MTNKTEKLITGLLAIGFLTLPLFMSASITVNTRIKASHGIRFHTLTLGDDNNSPAIMGKNNTLYVDNGLIIGVDNSGQGELSSIGGGQGNHVAGDYAGIAGGSGNSVTGKGGIIGGGQGNSINGDNATIVGGSNNSATTAGNILGGSNNSADKNGTVLGGNGNTANENSLSLGQNAGGGESSFARNGGTKGNDARVNAENGMLIGTNQPMPGVDLVVSGAIKLNENKGKSFSEKGMRGELRLVNGCFYEYDGLVWNLVSESNTEACPTDIENIAKTCKFGTILLKEGDSTVAYSQNIAPKCNNVKSNVICTGGKLLDARGTEYNYPYCNDGNPDTPTPGDPKYKCLGLEPSAIFERSSATPTSNIGWKYDENPSKACTYKCPEKTHPQSSSCIQNICGSKPEGTSRRNGNSADNTPTTNLATAFYTETKGGACSYKCDDTHEWNGSSCVEAQYTCSWPSTAPKERNIDKNGTKPTSNKNREYNVNINAACQYRCKTSECESDYIISNRDTTYTAYTTTGCIKYDANNLCNDTTFYKVTGCKGNTCSATAQTGHEHAVSYTECTKVSPNMPHNCTTGTRFEITECESGYNLVNGKCELSAICNSSYPYCYGGYTATGNQGNLFSTYLCKLGASAVSCNCPTDQVWDNSLTKCRNKSEFELCDDTHYNCLLGATVSNTGTNADGTNYTWTCDIRDLHESCSEEIDSNSCNGNNGFVIGFTTAMAKDPDKGYGCNGNTCDKEYVFGLRDPSSAIPDSFCGWGATEFTIKTDNSVCYKIEDIRTEMEYFLTSGEQSILSGYLNGYRPANSFSGDILGLKVAINLFKKDILRAKKNNDRTNIGIDTTDGLTPQIFALSRWQTPSGPSGMSDSYNFIFNTDFNKNFGDLLYHTNNIHLYNRESGKDNTYNSHSTIGHTIKTDNIDQYFLTGEQCSISCEDFLDGLTSSNFSFKGQFVHPNKSEVGISTYNRSSRLFVQLESITKNVPDYLQIQVPVSIPTKVSISNSSPTISRVDKTFVFPGERRFYGGDQGDIYLDDPNTAGTEIGFDALNNGNSAWRCMATSNPPCSNYITNIGIYGTPSIKMEDIRCCGRGETCEPQSCTISYHANEGTDAPDARYGNKGETTIIPDQIPERENYAFKYRSTSDNGYGQEYYPGDTITCNTNTTLYATWGTIPICYTVSRHQEGYRDYQYEFNFYLEDGNIAHKNLTFYFDILGTTNKIVTIYSGTNYSHNQTWTDSTYSVEQTNYRETDIRTNLLVHDLPYGYTYIGLCNDEYTPPDCPDGYRLDNGQCKFVLNLDYRYDYGAANDWLGEEYTSSMGHSITTSLSLKYYDNYDIYNKDISIEIPWKKFYMQSNQQNNNCYVKLVETGTYTFSVGEYYDQNENIDIISKNALYRLGRDDNLGFAGYFYYLEEPRILDENVVLGESYSTTFDSDTIYLGGFDCANRGRRVDAGWRDYLGPKYIGSRERMGFCNVLDKVNMNNSNCTTLNRDCVSTSDGLLRDYIRHSSIRY